MSNKTGKCNLEIRVYFFGIMPSTVKIQFMSSLSYTRLCRAIRPLIASIITSKHRSKKFENHLHESFRRSIDPEQFGQRPGTAKLGGSEGPVLFQTKQIPFKESQV